MRIYGLTGGIGSGKSEVAEILQQTGIPVIDADAIGHALLEPTGAGFASVVKAFGNEVLMDGAIDRAKLSSMVFSNEALRLTLNAILHPLILKEVAHQCARLAEQGREVIVIEAALLGEDGKKDSFLDGLILVTCPETVRLQRLVEIRGMALDDAKRRIASQIPPENKLALSDHVIDNSGEIKALRLRVMELAEELLAHG